LNERESLVSIQGDHKPTKAGPASTFQSTEVNAVAGPASLAGSESEQTLVNSAAVAASPADADESPDSIDELESVALIEVRIDTQFGGLFFLINLGLYLGLYGDFSTPAEPGIQLNIWDFVALVGRELLGCRIETDPVWKFLAHLAGRDEETQPGRGFEPDDAWRVPLEWLEPFATDDDLASNAMAGWIYWLLYVKGALQSADGGAVGPGNAYYDLLAGHWKNNDPGRAADLSDEDRLAELVSRRFADFELFRSRPDAAHVMQPIRLVVPAGPPTPSRARGVKRIYEFDREVPVETTTIDGYHRLFLARLFGHTHAPCDFVAEEDAVIDSNA